MPIRPLSSTAERGRNEGPKAAQLPDFLRRRPAPEMSVTLSQLLLFFDVSPTDWAASFVRCWRTRRANRYESARIS